MGGETQKLVQIPSPARVSPSDHSCSEHQPPAPGSFVEGQEPSSGDKRLDRPSTAQTTSCRAPLSAPRAQSSAQRAPAATAMGAARCPAC